MRRRAPLRPPPSAQARRARAATLQACLPPDPDLGVVAEHEPVGLRLGGHSVHADVLADEAVLDPAAFEHDAVLDLGVADFDVVHDRRERADVAVEQARARADDRRATDHRVPDDGRFLDDDLALDPGHGVEVAVDAAIDGVENQPVGLEHVLEAAGVLPPAVDDLGTHHEAAVDEILNRVGDLELLPEAWLDARDRFEDLRTEQVHADKGEIALGLPRLLHQPHDAAVVELGDAELLRIVDLRQQNLRGRAIGPELIDERLESFVEKVDAEIHHERRLAEERLADLHRMGQPPGRVLRDVRDADAPLRSVADGAANLLVRVPDDNPDIVYAGGGHGFDAIEQHRLVGDGHELLRARVGQRPQPRAFAPAQDQAFHRDLSARAIPRVPPGFAATARARNS